MNCTVTYRLVTGPGGTSAQYGHKPCGAPATRVKELKAAYHDYTVPDYRCEEHTGPGYELIVAAGEPAEVVEYRETVLTVAGVERIVRTEMGGKVRTVKQLEAAHTKTVKAALVEMRRANLPALEVAAKDAERLAADPHAGWAVKDAAKRARNIARRAERGTLHSHGTYDVATMRKPHPPVRYTETVPEYLVEVEPGHYATHEAAEQLSLI